MGHELSKIIAHPDVAVLVSVRLGEAKEDFALSHLGKAETEALLRRVLDRLLDIGIEERGAH